MAGMTPGITILGTMILGIMILGITGVGTEVTITDGIIITTVPPTALSGASEEVTGFTGREWRQPAPPQGAVLDLPQGLPVSEAPRLQEAGQVESPHGLP